MPFILGPAHSQSPYSCTQASALPPSPTVIDSKESIVKGLKRPFSETNNAWIVSLMRDPSGCFEPLKPSTYLYVFSEFIRAAWWWHPHVKLLCSQHHSVTFSTLSSLIATSCHSQLLLRKTILKGAQDLLTKYECISPQSFGAVTTLGGFLYPLPSSFSSSQNALHEPVF